MTAPGSTGFFGLHGCAPARRVIGERAPVRVRSPHRLVTEHPMRAFELPSPRRRADGVALAGFAAMVLGATVLGAGPAAARAESVGAGLWDMSRPDLNRGCRLTLRSEESGPGRHALGAPAGCRKALPILAAASGWTSVEGGIMRLLGKDGGPLLDFAPKTDGGLEAMGPEGEIYRLTSQGGARMRWAGEGRAQTAQAAPATAVAPPRAALAGRYAILREDDKDTGCMVTLEDRGGRGPKGSSRAFLAPACRDQGLVIFNPVGWALVGGKLTLYAQKGHALSFLPGVDGRSWAKDPASGGKPVSLRRL